MAVTLQSDISAVATIAGINLGGFQGFAGGEEAGEVVTDRVPGKRLPDKRVTDPDISNITIRRTWDETRDRPLYDQLKGRTNAPGSCGRLVRDEAGNIANTEPFLVKMVRSAGPEGDANGGQAKSEWVIELTVTGRA